MVYSFFMPIFVPMKCKILLNTKVDTATGELVTIKQQIVSSNVFFMSINSENYSKWLKKVKSIDHFLIAIYVAYNHDKNENCFSTSINKYHVDKLAKMVGKSDRTVYRMINDLIANNIIKRQSNQLFANPKFFIKSTNPKMIDRMVKYYNEIHSDSKMPLSKEF